MMTTYEELSKMDFDSLGMLSEENTKKLLWLILRETGIKFNTITETKRKRRIENDFVTDRVRPEMGVVGRWIEDFNFGLYCREPDLERGLLSYCPSLSYNHFGGGSNGFSVDRWFWFNIERKEWFIK